MYAIIRSGGKQYKVQKGDFIDVELLEGAEGENVEFKEVLFIGDKKSQAVGNPVVKGATVKGKLVDTAFGPKVTTMVFKRRKNIRRTFGHRQRYSRVEIIEVKKSAAKAEKKEEAKQED